MILDMDIILTVFQIMQQSRYYHKGGKGNYKVANLKEGGILGMNSNTITTKNGTQIYYKDWGKGPVVTFSHGWPLNSMLGTAKCFS